MIPEDVESYQWMSSDTSLLERSSDTSGGRVVQVKVEDSYQ